MSELSFGSLLHVGVNNGTIIVNTVEETKTKPPPTVFGNELSFADLAELAGACTYSAYDENSSYCETRCSNCEAEGAVYEQNTWGNWILQCITDIPLIGLTTTLFTKQDFHLLAPMVDDVIDIEIEEDKPKFIAPIPVQLEAPRKPQTFTDRELEVAQYLNASKRADRLQLELDKLKAEAEENSSNRFNDLFQQDLRNRA